jgi:NAD(P)-dependent dehydrogenase (short-subunit alcohol dehydrogenase family)
MLQGNVAVVTGSTSSIGLGIARALGGGGADIMLNGFGDESAIEQLRLEVAAELRHLVQCARRHEWLPCDWLRIRLVDGRAARGSKSGHSYASKSAGPIKLILQNSRNCHVVVGRAPHEDLRLCLSSQTAKVNSSVSMNR